MRDVTRLVIAHCKRGRGSFSATQRRCPLQPLNFLSMVNLILPCNYKPTYGIPGSAIYVYYVQPSLIKKSTKLTFILDDKPIVSLIEPPSSGSTGLRAGLLAFSQLDLPEQNHNLRITLGSDSTFLLDRIVYTKMEAYNIATSAQCVIYYISVFLLVIGHLKSWRPSHVLVHVNLRRVPLTLLTEPPSVAILPPLREPLVVWLGSLLFFQHFLRSASYDEEDGLTAGRITRITHLKLLIEPSYSRTTSPRPTFHLRWLDRYHSHRDTSATQTVRPWHLHPHPSPHTPKPTQTLPHQTLRP
jgi:hypothetical protein